MVFRILRIKVYYEITHQPIFDVTENSVVTILPTENKQDIFTIDEQKILTYFPMICPIKQEVSNLTGFGKDKVLNLNTLVRKMLKKLAQEGKQDIVR